MSVDHSLLTNSALQVLKVRDVVHEEVLCEDCGAEWFSDDTEAFFPVHVAVWDVGSDAASGEVLDGCLTEAFCELVGRCLSFAGIDAPAVGIEPLGAVSGGVDMDADEDDVWFAESVAVGVYAADTFG